MIYDNTHTIVIIMQLYFEINLGPSRKLGKFTVARHLVSH